VVDYAQNLGLPHFGGEQPGDTYYYSPLAVYCFGVVDTSCTPEVLHCYGYTEDHGTKGGNNVASLIMKALSDFGWIDAGKCGKRLSFVMDNCSGQNKNGHVLRLGLLLVELGFFKSVEFIFFVRGHTKNVCDRMFNLLKKRYHQSQIYSVESLSTLLNTVTAFDHCILMENRLQLLSSARCNMRPMSAPGMKHIKQVELWQKWGPFIPEPYRDCLCAKPSDTVINAVAMERRSRQRSRIQSRRDSTR